MWIDSWGSWDVNISDLYKKVYLWREQISIGMIRYC